MTFWNLLGLQAKGNACFSAGQFEEAIKFFTDAIAIDGSNHVLFSNRSASHVRGAMRLAWACSLGFCTALTAIATLLCA